MTKLRLLSNITKWMQRRDVQLLLSNCHTWPFPILNVAKHCYAQADASAQLNKFSSDVFTSKQCFNKDCSFEFCQILPKTLVKPVTATSSP